MVQKIALFNPIGGVSKTTIFHLGWMLAEKGKKVILADTNPQCNLTGMALGEGTEEGEERIEQIYNTKSNIKTGLAPAFESQPKAIEAIDCIPIEGRDGLFLLPGNVGFAEYEVTLGLAQQLSGSIQTLKNLPGAINYLFERTAEKLDADYILIDMSPSLGSINQNLLMISDFFMVPTTADLFSVMAINSLSEVLPKWYRWAKSASALPILRDADYPFPDVTLRFLGTIIQNNYRIKNDKETRAVQKWVNRIQETVSGRLVPILQTNNMTLPNESYKYEGIQDTFTLAKITYFNSLIGLSQEYQTPVYSLKGDYVNLTGSLLEQNQRKQEEFRETFSNLADKVIELTAAYAVSH
ncbi:AAA family ATPase [Planktothrix agardhii 1029]|jgi:cellulose biosynthesis protein BcsQ|nr:MULTISPECIES: AAA family ATPase [Planktothrix]MBG0746463.1 AAA family ATPase [Planktothrix agardhii KL2]MCB8764262.1 AAA family ATPase [Planktothrix agardhii 1809]MCB8777919.1 AAA family ATPase [Planktothrix agardhii 1031]MCB8782318.1 AAA family ATPase [Planktothrix agardhii 1808]MCF3566653.1 AAA family ATPase [Planktothrix agardhii 1807]